MKTSEQNQEKPEVTWYSLLDMQVCVSAEWSDADVLRFAEDQFPCGTANGWCIRRAGSERLSGMPERDPCADRAGFVHIMLDA